MASEQRRRFIAEVARRSVGVDRPRILLIERHGEVLAALTARGLAPTPDGWSELVGGALAGTNGFAGTGSGEHYTVGVAGRMQRWDGGRWNDEATGFGRALWAVWASEHEAVAVGDGGVILRKRLR